MAIFTGTETESGILQLASGVFGTLDNIIDPDGLEGDGNVTETLDGLGLSDVTVTFDANGDFNQTSETISISVNGEPEGTLFNSTAGDNGPWSVEDAGGAYSADADTITTGWDFIEINGNRGYPRDDTSYGGSQYDPADFDPVDISDFETIVANSADMTFDTDSPVFSATFETLDSISFDIGEPFSPFGVDAAEINYTLTSEFETEFGFGAISNFVAYLDCDGDPACAETKVKLDEWSNLEEFGIEVEDLTQDSVETWLASVGFGVADGCELVALTVKTGGPPNADFGPGEGELVLGTEDDICAEALGATVPDDNTFDMTIGTYEDFFV